jgi:putative phosphonate metabolism protein
VCGRDKTAFVGGQLHGVADQGRGEGDEATFASVHGRGFRLWRTRRFHDETSALTRRRRQGERNIGSLSRQFALTAKSMPPRYAIYFVPAAETALYQTGASLLGYDVYSGKPLPFPGGLALGPDDWHALTSAPRVYGFHATLKAPFRLAPGRSAEELAVNLAAFAAARAPVAIMPAVRTIGSFAAVIPAEPSAAVDRLAADCVRTFDPFRAPLNDDERRKRLASPLSAQLKENLERWGYPYVFDDFRFHMTLTGKITPACQEPVLTCLRNRLSAIEGRPLAVDRVALLCQSDRDTPFHLVASAPLSAR